MDEARSGPGLESGSAMGDGMDATRSESSANPGLRQQAMESVRDAREQLTTQVRERAGSARDSATRIADERKRTLAESVHALASAFDAAAASLSEGQQNRLAEWTRELSGRAHRIAGYLDEQDTRGLVTDLEGTARTHPTAFLGTTFAAGLAAGRFLRSSTRTDSGLPVTSGEVDFEFHPDAALLADDTGFSAGSGYGNPGSGYGTTGSSVGATRSGPGDLGFGPTRTDSPATGEYRAGGHVGTGGAGLASRAAGSTPIGAGTGGLNQGGAIGDDLSSTNRDTESSSNPERPADGQGGLS